MDESGVAFGTSGARGLAESMTDAVCFAYASGFLQHVARTTGLRAGARIALAGDLRASTDRILHAVAAAIRYQGYEVEYCGRIPTPAIAFYGIVNGIPSIMVTGSHVPDDRNGIKFHSQSGEILKSDEASIREEVVSLPAWFEKDALVAEYRRDLKPTPAAARAYVDRYLKILPPDFLQGQNLGLYEHSAVGRDLCYEILAGLGASVIRYGRTDRFVPVDTEAIRPEDVALAARMAEDNRFFAQVSTDGDGDRPLLADEAGRWLRGDTAGILCARYLHADVVVVPLTCNSAVERSQAFKRVLRTKVGSPYVIAEMLSAVAEGAPSVVGYEANGGFLTASPVKMGHGELSPLPTRDAMILQLAILAMAKETGKTISELLDDLPARFTASGLLANYPTERAQGHLKRLAASGAAAIEAAFRGEFGTVVSIDTTDGLRVVFQTGRMVHLRPSGNAPELRCYTEAEVKEEAVAMLGRSLEIVRSWNVTS